MRGPRGAKDLRLYKDEYDEHLYQGAIDETEQVAKWKNEQVERTMPRPFSLDEFLKTFELVPPPGPGIEFVRDSPTSKTLSPVLLGHEASRARRARLNKELEEAVPEGTPKNFLLPPAWSES